MSAPRRLRAQLAQRVRALVRRLPPPRDEAALTVLRGARALLKGTTPTASAAAYAKEQWIREVEKIAPSAEPGGARPVDSESTDPAERSAVRAGWQLVDAYERLSLRAAKRVFGHELDAWYEYARSTVPNLKPWKGASALRVDESDGNRLRFRRTMDFVRPGERVFDVGFGRGYLAGLLLRDRALAAYHGIDIVPRHITATQSMLEANGFTEADVDLRMGDVYELTPEQVAASGADLVICCEVLEHVPDPEKALQALANALPPGTDLLFSVPLHGRLEHVWGHATVFDVARLKAMIGAADLVVHHVEPLANTWTIVVASRNRRGSPRVRDASARPPVNVSVPLTTERDFVDVPASAISGDKQRSCEFAVRGLAALRLELKMIDFSHVLEVDVDVYTGSRRVGRWSWQPRREDVATTTKPVSRRFALRPGESSATFQAVSFADLGAADRVAVTLSVKPGHTAEFDLRAAYLPRSPELRRSSPSTLST